jgi:hypothetical protein
MEMEMDWSTLVVSALGEGRCSEWVDEVVRGGKRGEGECVHDHTDWCQQWSPPRPYGSCSQCSDTGTTWAKGDGAV